MAVLLQILQIVGVILNVVFVVWLCRLYFKKIHIPVWQRLHNKFGDNFSFFGSLLLLALLFYVVGTVFVAALEEWSGVVAYGSGLLQWLASLIALPLEMLAKLIQVPLIWLQALTSWFLSLTELIKVLVCLDHFSLAALALSLPVFC